MKVKDWIKELEKLDPEDELYVDNDGWGFQALTPVSQKRDLIKNIVYKRSFIREDNGGKGEPMGKCSTLKLCYW